MGEDMKINLVLMVGALLLTASLPRVAAQSKADGAETDVSFSLVVKLDGAYNKGFILCTLIRPSEPFNVEWVQGNLKSSISGWLRQPEGEVYPLTPYREAGRDRYPGSELYDMGT